MTGLRIQYRTTHSESYIDQTVLARSDGGGGALLLVEDETDRNESDSGSFYEPPFLEPGYQDLTADEGILGLRLTVHLNGGGQAVALYGARLTLASRQEAE